MTKTLAQKIVEALFDLASADGGLLKDRAVNRVAEVLAAHDPIRGINEDLARKTGGLDMADGPDQTVWFTKDAIGKYTFISDSSDRALEAAKDDRHALGLMRHNEKFYG